MTSDIYHLLSVELINVASETIGITEATGRNDGPMVEAFQKAVDGVAHGEPWCMAWVHWCIIEAEKRVSNYGNQPFHMSDLYKSESTMKVWNRSREALEIIRPEPGCLMFWQRHDKYGKPTWMGHVGIVSDVLSKDMVRTIEGNTSSGPGDQREGEGVFSKTRHIRHSIGSLRPKGFLSVW